METPTWESAHQKCLTARFRYLVHLCNHTVVMGDENLFILARAVHVPALKVVQDSVSRVTCLWIGANPRGALCS
jgi:hypothetical protein